jgi:hypothetical protein
MFEVLQERHTEKHKAYKQKNDVSNFKDYSKRMKTCFLLPLDVEGADFLWNVFNSKNIGLGICIGLIRNAAVYESVLNHRLGTGVPVNRRI